VFQLVYLAIDRFNILNLVSSYLSVYMYLFCVWSRRNQYGVAFSNTFDVVFIYMNEE